MSRATPHVSSCTPSSREFCTQKKACKGRSTHCLVEGPLALVAILLVLLFDRALDLPVRCVVRVVLVTPPKASPSRKVFPVAVKLPGTVSPYGGGATHARGEACRVVLLDLELLDLVKQGLVHAVKALIIVAVSGVARRRKVREKVDTAAVLPVAPVAPQPGAPTQDLLPVAVVPCSEGETRRQASRVQGA